MGEDSPSHKRVTTLEEEVHGKHKVHHDHYPKRGRARINRRVASLVAATIVTILVLLGITVLVLWLVYKPEKPKFVLLEAAILTNTIPNNTGFTALPPYMVSMSMQFTIGTTNPNKRVSIYYKDLSSFVTYHNQIITNPVALPSLYHRKHSTVLMSPILGGSDYIPVSQDVMYGLGMDEAMGVVNMRLNIVGRLKWKAGAIKTAHYHVYVYCDFLVRLPNGFVGQVPFLTTPVCKVDV